jgi:hypothetical protein
MAGRESCAQDSAAVRTNRRVGHLGLPGLVEPQKSRRAARSLADLTADALASVHASASVNLAQGETSANADAGGLSGKPLLRRLECFTATLLGAQVLRQLIPPVSPTRSVLRSSSALCVDLLRALLQEAAEWAGERRDHRVLGRDASLAGVFQRVPQQARQPPIVGPRSETRGDRLFVTSDALTPDGVPWAPSQCPYEPAWLHRGSCGRPGWKCSECRERAGIRSR